jgi:hypothetical protein
MLTPPLPVLKVVEFGINPVLQSTCGRFYVAVVGKIVPQTVAAFGSWEILMRCQHGEMTGAKFE